MINPIVSNSSFALGSDLANLLIISAQVSRAFQYYLVKLVMNLGAFELSYNAPSRPITL